MDPASGDDLLIKRASGRDFTAVSTLPASSENQSDDQSSPARQATAIRSLPTTPSLPHVPEDKENGHTEK